MIVDCHSHVWDGSAKFGRSGGLGCLGRCEAEAATPGRHLECAEPAQVTLVLGFVSDHLEAAIPNDFIQRYVGQYPERLIGLAGVDPTRKSCLDELEQLHNEHGFRGVTVSPACQNFHPCDTRAMRLYELAEQLAMPIYVLQGGTLAPEAVLSYADPVHWDEIGRTFGSLKVVISHLGYPWVEQTLALLGKQANFYSTITGLADKPAQAYRALTLAHEYGVIDKLLFASGFPCHSVKTAAEALYNLNKITLDSVLPAVPREQLRSIVERDSLSLLGLKRASGIAEVPAGATTAGAKKTLARQQP